MCIYIIYIDIQNTAFGLLCVFIGTLCKQNGNGYWIITVANWPDKPKKLSNRRQKQIVKNI